MLKPSSCICLPMLLSIYLLFGCGGAVNTAPTPGPPSGNFPVLVFSDLHFNPFYDPNLTTYTTLCTSTASSGWPTLFSGFVS